MGKRALVVVAALSLAGCSFAMRANTAPSDEPPNCDSSANRPVLDGTMSVLLGLVAAIGHYSVAPGLYDVDSCDEVDPDSKEARLCFGGAYNVALLIGAAAYATSSVYGSVRTSRCRRTVRRYNRRHGHEPPPTRAPEPGPVF